MKANVLGVMSVIIRIIASLIGIALYIYGFFIWPAILIPSWLGYVLAVIGVPDIVLVFIIISFGSITHPFVILAFCGAGCLLLSFILIVIARAVNSRQNKG